MPTLPLCVVTPEAAVARGVFVPRAGPPPYNHTCRLLKARWHTAPACAEHGKWPLKTATPHLT